MFEEELHRVFHSVRVCITSFLSTSLAWILSNLEACARRSSVKRFLILSSDMPCIIQLTAEHVWSCSGCLLEVGLGLIAFGSVSACSLSTSYD